MKKSLSPDVHFRALTALVLLNLLSACGGSGGASGGVVAVKPSASQYVKICNNGEQEDTGACPAKPALGIKPTDWACTLDTASGLIWEVKTPWQLNPQQDDFRNAKHTYTNYDNTQSPQLSVPGPGGVNGTYQNPKQQDLDVATNSLGFASQVNGLTGLAPLCSKAGWRRPTQSELQGLLDLGVTSVPASAVGFAFTKAAINEAYFPNTNPSEPYIVSTPSTDRAYDPVLYTNNITFKTINKTIADQLMPWQRGGNYRAPLRLVADCNCKIVGSTQTARDWGKSVLLPNGLVLSMGGAWSNSVQFLGFGELFNAATTQWSSSGSFTTNEAINLPIERHSATLMGNKVVVIGGDTIFNGADKKVWIYDTGVQTWSPGQSSVTKHMAHGAVAVGSNKIFVLGGDCDVGVSRACYSGSVEAYDISTNTWAQKAAMPTPLHSATTTLMADGRILVAGGHDNTKSISKTQIYNPVTDTWASGISDMNESRYYHTATLLKDGRVLIAGGNSRSPGASSYTPSKTAEIFDPATNTWSLVAPMSIERTIHTATLLADGRVLAAGGGGFSTNATATVEIYDPKSNRWTAACNLLNIRYGHNATMLADGARILISGGRNASSSLLSAEIYTP